MNEADENYGRVDEVFFPQLSCLWSPVNGIYFSEWLVTVIKLSCDCCGRRRVPRDKFKSIDTQLSNTDVTGSNDGTSYAGSEAN